MHAIIPQEGNNCVSPRELQIERGFRCWWLHFEEKGDTVADRCACGGLRSAMHLLYLYTGRMALSLEHFPSDIL